MTTLSPPPTMSSLRYLRRGQREHAPARMRVAAMFSVVALLHILGFGLAALADLTAASAALPIGIAVTAYGLGLRHALDADHVAGIDNATRKFVGEGRRPVSVGLAFSLGHSTVVLAMAVLVALGAAFAADLLRDDNPIVSFLGVVGATIAAAFLLMIAGVNGSGLRRMLAARRQGRNEPPRDATRMMSERILSAPLSRVREPRHIYILGVLFGLGFDTASTIGMVALTVSVTLSGSATWLVLCLPVCFAAGMTLIDAAEGIVMMKLYSSGQFADRDRQLFNIVATALSVIAAAGIGTVIAVGTVHEVFSLSDPVTTWVAQVDLEHVGWVLAVGFVVLWFVAATILYARRRTPPLVRVSA